MSQQADANTVQHGRYRSGDSSARPQSTDFEEMTKQELVDWLSEHGQSASLNSTKAELVAAAEAV